MSMPFSQLLHRHSVDANIYQCLNWAESTIGKAAPIYCAIRRLAGPVLIISTQGLIHLEAFPHPGPAEAQTPVYPKPTLPITLEGNT